MIEDLIKELQELEALQAKIEVRLQRLAHKVKTNRANKNERNQYKSLKGSLQSATQKAHSVKTSISQINTSARRKMQAEMEHLFKTGQTFGEMKADELFMRHFPGPFDALSGEAYWQKAAKSAGNRINAKHPDFFQKYGQLDDILDIIWSNYASYHKYFKYGLEPYQTDEELYADLIDVLDDLLERLQEY